MDFPRWLLVVSALAVAPSLVSGAALAQEATSTPPAPDAGSADPDANASETETDADLLDEETLDELVAPVALYPDALLAQIFVAATFPLDIVKADRFIEENPDLSDQERNDQAGQQDWDPSIAALAGGFPTVVARMAEDLDWTEQLGDAMLAQTDDLLDAVQRQRARAQATGYLTSNDAQVVEDDGESISIEPADPEVIYVPTYDSTAAYTTAPTAAPVVAESGVSTTSLVTTGAIAFGSALLIDEIFDDDDDDYWHGPDHIDWDDDAVYPHRGGINVNGDVNIDRTRDRDRNTVRIGDIDRDKIDRDGAWKPSPQQRDDARQRLADRDRTSGRTKGAAADARLKAQRPSGGGDDARARLANANAKREASGKPSIASSKPAPRSSALHPSAGGSPKARAAEARGSGSLSRSKAPPAVKSKARPHPPAAKPKSISRPTGSGAHKAKARPAPKSTAFKKSSSGKRAKAASHRGGSSRGHGGKRR